MEMEICHFSKALQDKYPKWRKTRVFSLKPWTRFIVTMATHRCPRAGTRDTGGRGGQVQPPECKCLLKFSPWARCLPHPGSSPATAHPSQCPSDKLKPEGRGNSKEPGQGGEETAAGHHQPCHGGARSVSERNSGFFHGWPDATWCRGPPSGGGSRGLRAGAPAT